MSHRLFVKLVLLLIHLRKTALVFKHKRSYFILLSCLLVVTAACRGTREVAEEARPRPFADNTPPVVKGVVEAAVEQTRYTVSYDPSYVRLDYPGGDMPKDRGVCTDVVIRAFRAAGVDLQKDVHEDMRAGFAAYPKKWGLSKPDPNIDHRRVPNLMTFFERKERAVQITNRAEDYLPGDVVAWDLGNGLTHIGMMSNLWSDATQNYMVVHNIGGGARLENVLFNWRIIGHYRYF